jgi:hypothetical protein
MDEFKIIIWIIIGLVYLFARKKKAPVAPPTRRSTVEPQEYTPPAPKPVTFEELLREIQGMKEPEPELTPAPTPVTSDYGRPPVKRDWERKLEDSEAVKKQLEDTNYDYRKHDKIYDLYDTATEQAFSRPSLEESMKLDSTIVRFKQFKNYENESKPSLLQSYVKELRDPQGFKKAFIMSEILNRRF